jgi:hypothetical protein
VDTETGEATQYMRNQRGEKFVRYEPPMSDFGLPESEYEVAVPDPERPGRYRVIKRRAVVATQEIKLPLPVRVEPLA